MILLTEHINDFDLETALKQVSEQRRKYALRYKNERDRRLCIKAYLLLCEGLQKEYGITDKPHFHFGKFGKPVLADFPHIHFNLSHCKDAVICVLGNSPMGVDIESVIPFDKELALQTMNEEEMRQITLSQCPDIEFMRYWTQKEAVLKLWGYGIQNNMKNILDNNVQSLTTFVSPNKKFVYSITEAFTI